MYSIIICDVIVQKSWCHCFKQTDSVGFVRNIADNWSQPCHVSDVLYCKPNNFKLAFRRKLKQPLLVFLITTHDLCEEVSSLVDALRLKHTQAVSLSSVLWRQEIVHDCYTSVCSKHTHTHTKLHREDKVQRGPFGECSPVLRLMYGRSNQSLLHTRENPSPGFILHTHQKEKKKGLKFLQLLYIQDICEIVCALAWWSFTWHACLQAAAPYCYIWNFWFTQMCYTHTHIFHSVYWAGFFYTSVYRVTHFIH